MSDFKFERDGKLRSRGFYAAAMISLVAIGAAAWFAIGQRAMPTADADTASSTATSHAAVKIPTNTADATTSQSDTKDRSKSASSTASAFAPTDAVDVQAVTPKADFFVMPINGDVIKDYSDTELQYSLTYKDWRLHKAIDIKGNTGDQIIAAGDGTVIAVYDDAKLGLTVEINHGNDITAVYSGLETAVVTEGDVVGVNMQIGTLGKIPSECVETTHLHFSVKIGDKSVSPLNIIGT